MSWQKLNTFLNILAHPHLVRCQQRVHTDSLAANESRADSQILHTHKEAIFY